MPEQLFVATDGSGAHQGSSAFLIAWRFFRGRWYRIGWYAADLPNVAWLSQSSRDHCRGLQSFHGELVALQAAALWATYYLDVCQLLMSARPVLMTVAVDNVAALQIAAGAASARDPVARQCRAFWQSLQARCNTTFRHVHSHQGTQVNTFADALANFACQSGIVHRVPWLHEPAFYECLAAEESWLWTIPRAVLGTQGPILRLTKPVGGPGLAAHESAIATATPACPGAEEASAQDRVSLPLHIVTVNVQTMRDACPNPFNPSGHATRRQYYYDQLHRQRIDIMCIQEARSRTGRWSTAGVLTWRTGSAKGQYGCKIWVRPGVTQPPLTLDSFRTVVSEPRILVVTCNDPRMPLTIVSAHAPHADRPGPEATAFWASLRNAIYRAPAGRSVVAGIDANADFQAPDEAGCLVGDRLGQSEPNRNDDFLLECCLQLGLEAPATFSEYQHGPGWSWEHTGGTRKRLDHLLFAPGPWHHKATGQAWDFDLCTDHRDHVALRIHTQLECTSAAPAKAKQRRCTPEEATQHGHLLWQLVRRPTKPVNDAMCPAQQLSQQHAAWLAALPPKPRVVARQPYISTSTLKILQRLRDWRAQRRSIAAAAELQLIKLCLICWRNPCDAVATAHRYEHKQMRLNAAAVEHQVGRISRQAHDAARRDKEAHFLQLTQGAADTWHATGRPQEAIVKLRWASRRTAERRGVHAAGGYQIEDALEDQFRQQEGGQLLAAHQLQRIASDWWQQPAQPCFSVMPTLLDMEASVHRQARNKAPGPDGVRNEIWRGHPAYAGEWFWQLCSGIAAFGREPLHFKLAIVCALYKKGPASLPQNYRSIALLIMAWPRSGMYMYVKRPDSQS